MKGSEDGFVQCQSYAIVWFEEREEHETTFLHLLDDRREDFRHAIFFIRGQIRIQWLQRTHACMSLEHMSIRLLWREDLAPVDGLG